MLPCADELATCRPGAAGVGVRVCARGRRTGSGGPGAADLEKDPFKGITTDGMVQRDLFAIRSRGVSTKPVMDAAVKFIGVLTPEQRKASTFAVDDLSGAGGTTYIARRAPGSHSRR